MTLCLRGSIGGYPTAHVVSKCPEKAKDNQNTCEARVEEYTYEFEQGRGTASQQHQEHYKQQAATATGLALLSVFH